MPRQRVDNFGQIGIISDLHTAALPPNAVEYGFNVLTEDGVLRSNRGEMLLVNFGIRPTYHYAYVNQTSSTTGLGMEQLLIVSNGTKIYWYSLAANRLGVWEDITPVGDLGGGPVSFCTLNGILVVNCERAGPFYWADPTKPLVRLPGWPEEWRCRYMTAYKYYLVAMNMIDTVAGNPPVVSHYPHVLRWSNSADPGSVPAEWAPKASNDAGDAILGDSEGPITGAVTIRDSLWVIKTDAIYALDWVGGQYIMQPTRIKGGIGASMLHGFTEMLGGIALYGSDDVVFFDGNQYRSMVDSQVKRAIFNTESTEYWQLSRIFAVPSHNKLLVAAPDSRSVNRLAAAYIYDWDEKTWGHMQLIYGLGFDLAFVSLRLEDIPWGTETVVDPEGHNTRLLGTVYEDPVIPTDIDHITDAELAAVRNQHNRLESIQTEHHALNMTKASHSIAWDDEREGTWNRGAFNPSAKQLILYESNLEDNYWYACVWGVGEGWHDGHPYLSEVSRTGIPIEGADGLAMITEVWPEITGNLHDGEALDFYVQGQAALRSIVKWQGPFKIVPNRTNHISPRLTGRFLGWKIKCDKPGHWKLASLTINWERAGER